MVPAAQETAACRIPPAADGMPPRLSVPLRTPPRQPGLLRCMCMQTDPAEKHRQRAEGDREKAEEFRRLAEAGREVRDKHRDALDALRAEQERVRAASAVERIAVEDART